MKVDRMELGQGDLVISASGRVPRVLLIFRLSTSLPPPPFAYPVRLLGAGGSPREFQGGHEQSWVDLSG